MERAKLEEYLGKVYYLERSLYEQNSSLNRLYQRLNEMEREKNKPIRTEPTHDANGDYVTSAMAYGFMGGIGSVIFMFVAAIAKWWKFNSFFGPLISFFLIGAVVGAIYGWFAESKSVAESEERNNKILEYNRQLYEQNNRRVQQINWQMDSIRREIRIMEQNRNENVRVSNCYYDKNIIYPKYRGLIPVASIYDYFKSGCCDCLTGHEGAYNKFDNELRMNLIISKLDDVLYKLDQIRNSQYMLYDAINYATQNSERLTNTVNMLANNMQSIAENQEVIAYNSRIAASNTEFLTWLEILN